MKVLTMFVLALSLIAGSAQAKTKHGKWRAPSAQAELTGAPAKKLFDTMDGERSNAGDGVVMKTGEVSCSDSAEGETHEYNCACGDEQQAREFEGAEAEAVYKLLPASGEVKGDDGVVTRFADVNCFEKGSKEPFHYLCQV